MNNANDNCVIMVLTATSIFLSNFYIPQTAPKCTSFPCLIFEDNFDMLDFTKWRHEITAGGGGVSDYI